MHLYSSCVFTICDTPFIQNLKKNNHMHGSQEDLLSACLKFRKAQLQQYVSLNFVSAASTDNKQNYTNFDPQEAWTEGDSPVIDATSDTVLSVFDIKKKKPEVRLKAPHVPLYFPSNSWIVLSRLFQELRRLIIH